MELTKWMPWNRERRVPVRYDGDPIVTLHHRIHQLFDDAFRGFEVSAPWAGDAGSNPWNAGFPRVDLSETDEEYRVEAELPGMDEKDVAVSLTRDALTIHGEKESESNGRRGEVRFAERAFGTFHRVLPLPGDVDAEHAEATYRNGVLSVRLPKSAEERGNVKQVEVRAG